MTATQDPRALVDTNILVYCYDEEDPVKHTRAKQLVQELVRSQSMVLSVQVLNEFYVAVTRPRREFPMMETRAKRIVEGYLRICRVLPLAGSTTEWALFAVGRFQLSFWDALIWAAAKEDGVSTIYTEDFQHDRDIDGVRFINPFVAG